MIAPSIGEKIRVSIITTEGEELEVMSCPAFGSIEFAMEGFTAEQHTQLLNAAYYLKKVFSMLVKEPEDD